MKKYFVIFLLILFCCPAFAGTTVVDATAAQKKAAARLVQSGMEEFHAGRFEEAFIHFQDALGYDPDCVEAHYGYGQILLQSGHKKEAIDSFKKVLRFSEDQKERQSASSIIKMVKLKGVALGVFFVFLYLVFGIVIFKRKIINKNLAFFFYIMAGIECIKTFQLFIH